MNTKVIGNDLYLYDRFDLSATLTCGQCFRWKQREDGAFEGVAFGKFLSVRQTEEAIIFENTSEEDFQTVWAPYFDLSEGQLSVYRCLCETPSLKEILKSCAPKEENRLHILRQEPWEALCSFILSQNNNIPRIEKIVASLCRNFGKEIAPKIFAFPTAEKLASLTAEDLAPIRSGFRAKYLIDAAKKVAGGEISFERIRNSDLVLARKELQTILGVGPKVAECALLYGLHRMEAFPMDVWMIRAMKTLFPGKVPEDFGSLAGIAQQYIYLYSRTHPELFSDEKT